MNDDFTDKIRSKRDDQKRSAEETRKHLEALSTTASSGSRVAKKLDETNKGLQKVAKSDDIQDVVDSINQLNMTTFVANKDSWTGIVENLAELAEKTQITLSKLEKDGVQKIEKSFTIAINKLDQTVSKLKTINVEADSDQKATLKSLVDTLNSLDVKPVVNVPQAKVTVQEKDVDFTPLLEVLSNVNDGISKLGDIQPTFDTSDLSDGIGKIEKAINKLINKPVPVPVTPSPFVNSTNQGKQALVDDAGRLVISGNAGPTNTVTGNASNTDGTSTLLIAAQGTSVKTYITDITLTNTSATTVYVELKDASTTKWTFPVPAGGGVSHSFTTPLPGTANTAWNFDPSAAATTIYCSAAGFTI